jgi:hypothetical protein
VDCQTGAPLLRHGRLQTKTSQKAETEKKMNGYSNPYDLIFSQQPGPLAAFRSSLATELNDPAIRQQLFSLTQREVGGQGPEAQHAFMESIFNRAAARGMSLGRAINDPNYFAAASFKPTSLSGEQTGRFGQILSNVVAGSNVSNFATGNASGTVGFGGGPTTFSAGGERFGIEKPDLGWVQKTQPDISSALTTQPGYQNTPSYLTSVQNLATQPAAAAPAAAAVAATTPETTPLSRGLTSLGAGLSQIGQGQAAAGQQGTQAAMQMLNKPSPVIPSVDLAALQQALQYYFS